jgi:hypothetical protein
VRILAFHVARRFPRWLRRFPGYRQQFEHAVAPHDE